MIALSFIGSRFAFSVEEDVAEFYIQRTRPDIELNSVELSSIKANGFLGLINSEYAVDENSTEQGVVSAYRVVPVSTSDLVLNSKTLEATKELFEEAEDAGFTEFFISSGYRSSERQKEIYEESLDKTYVQKPYHSEHQTGLALDIAYMGISAEHMSKSKAGIWLMKNAWKHGLILRYPEGKNSITKISFEPWHYRYVGIPHAYYCYINNLCFEEYIQFLKDTGGYEIEIDGITYLVFYESAEDGILQVPDGLEYEVSGDNTGYYVVTAKEN